MPKPDLTPKQRRAISALMTSPTLAAAAVELGMSVRQLYRWLDDPVFVAELKSAESAAIDQAVRRLVELSGAAVDTLDSAMHDDDASQGVKVRAADVALSQLLRLRELYDLEQRITALEAAQKAGT